MISHICLPDCDCDCDCVQVLWLYGDNHEITEVGAMNIFFVLKKDASRDSPLELVTAPLTRGDVLPGQCPMSVRLCPSVCLLTCPSLRLCVEVSLLASHLYF